MSKKPQAKKPSFAIRPSKSGQIWSVFHLNKGNRSYQAYEFASEKAAQNWVDYKSKAWLNQQVSRRP